MKDKTEVEQQGSKATERSPLPWEAFAEKIVVAEPERVRVVIRAANGYRVAVEDNPVRWEQALADFEYICTRVAAHAAHTEEAAQSLACEIVGKFHELQYASARHTNTVTAILSKYFAATPQPSGEDVRAELELLLNRVAELRLDEGFNSHYQNGFELFRSQMEAVIKARLAATPQQNQELGNAISDETRALAEDTFARIERSR